MWWENIQRRQDFFLFFPSFFFYQSNGGTPIWTRTQMRERYGGSPQNTFHLFTRFSDSPDTRTEHMLYGVDVLDFAGSADIIVSKKKMCLECRFVGQKTRKILFLFCRVRKRRHIPVRSWPIDTQNLNFKLFHFLICVFLTNNKWRSLRSASNILLNIFKFNGQQWSTLYLSPYQPSTWKSCDI